MKDEDKQVYISLAEAAARCNYSQEYLSLRARQGKLKSYKFGRNWVTTNEWLDDYMRSAETFNGTRNGRKYNPTSEQVKVSLAMSAAEDSFLTPGNLPVGEPNFMINYAARFDFLSRIFVPAALIILAALMGAVGLMPTTKAKDWQVTADVLYEYEAWLIERNLEASTAVFSFVADVAQGGSEMNARDMARIFQELFSVIKEDAQFVWSNIAERVGLAAEEKDVAVSNDKFVEETSKLQENIINDIQKRFGEFRGETGIAENKDAGLVVVPSGDNDEEVQQEIMTAFSDEVTVEQQNETSGIIRPIFKNMAEQAYLFMMVPMKN